MHKDVADEIKGIFKGPFHLDERSEIEWLETNGSGAFCCSTLIEKHDRKYHGLLVSPVDDHEGRYHILSAIDAVFHIGKD